jgi:hypothetical protein
VSLLDQIFSASPLWRVAPLARLEHMFDTADVIEVRDSAGEWVRELEPGLYGGLDALALLDVVSEVKRLFAAAETLLAARVADTDAWRDGSADRSAAHWLARRTGTSIAEAKPKLETAAQLADLPATAEAFRAGRLSDQQAREVVAGATADPQAEPVLLGTAAQDSLRELRNESRRAQAVDDGEARQRTIHARRRLQMGVDTDGTFRLSFSGTAVAGAAIVAALRPFTDQAFKQAKAEGRVESHAANQADGLVAMAGAAQAGDGPAPKANVKVIVVVDVAALRRGEVESGETCEIRGVGPVSVSAARELLGEAALAIVIKDGVAVLNVTHVKRRTTAHQRTALEFWGIKCEVVGCDSTDFVDVHHVFEFARSHHTRLDELRVSCKHHHRQEHKGWKPTAEQLRSRSRSKADDENELPLSA